MWEKLLRKNIVSVPPEWPQAIDPQEASVLVLMAHHPGQEDFQIVLTKRTQKVLHHKGQISFPGGVPEKEDPHLLATALRETHEEIGVPSEAIEILGMLDPVVTGFQVKIIPFLGLLSGPPMFKASPDEVEKILFLPGKVLLSRGIQPVIAREQAFEVKSVGIHWENELIWGATAKILEQIYKILKGIP